MPDDDRQALQDGLRLVAVALGTAEIPYALCGGYAMWARGAPEPSHDADFIILEHDVERARYHLASGDLPGDFGGENADRGHVSYGIA